MHVIAMVDTNRHIEKPFYFPGKKISRDFYIFFLRQRLLVKHEKRYSRDNHSIIREALQVPSNS